MTDHKKDAAMYDPAKDYEVENPVPQDDEAAVEVVQVEPKDDAPDVTVTHHPEDANPTQHKGDFVDEEGSND